MKVQSVSSLKRRLLGIVVAASVASLATLAADAPAGKSQAPPDKAQLEEQTKLMMELITKAAAPGPPHAVLMQEAGNWKTLNKAWMGPGDPVVTQGSASYKPILDGRFLVEEYHGTFMGRPFEGFSVSGYDNAKKEYVNVWMDNLGTMMVVSRGTMDASGKVLTLKSVWEDPVTGEASPVRSVTTFVDADTKTFEMYGTHGGQEMKQMEITYTRAK